MQEHDNLKDVLNVRAADEKLDVVERLLAAILAKVGPVTLTRDEYRNAPVADLEAREHRDDLVAALVTQFDADGEPLPGVFEKAIVEFAAWVHLAASAARQTRDTAPNSDVWKIVKGQIVALEAVRSEVWSLARDAGIDPAKVTEPEVKP